MRARIIRNQMRCEGKENKKETQTIVRARMKAGAGSPSIWFGFHSNKGISRPFEGLTKARNMGENRGIDIAAAIPPSTGNVNAMPTEKRERKV